MSLRSQWVYQGYNGRAGEYRRSPGMSPETGWIDLAATDLKNIRIVGRDLPWRTVGGTEVNGGLDILTWSKMKSSATVTSLPPLPAPQGGGLNPFGNLDLTTYDENGAKIRGMTYVDVYVGLSGIEEITEGLDEIETHQVGNIRVPLTDVRYYMQRCSPLFCNINKRLKSGDWDATSTKDGAQTPWAIDEVLQFLFSLLPGSPNIVSWSELYQLKDDIDPPSDIIGRGEPAKEWIEKVLERAGLEPHLLPDNTWAIHGKYSTKFAYKEMAGPGGAVVAVPSGGDPGFHYERKTSTQTGRPPAVIVHGGRRIKRGSFQMIPVLQDLDGFIYPMEDVVNRWGYSMDQVNKQVFSRNDTRFRDVPPTPESGGDGTLHEKRKKVLQNAYRMYAPAFMFTDPDGDDSAVDTQTAAQPNAMINPDRKFVAYLPIKDCAWYQSEFQAIRTSPPSKDTVGPGDKEDYVLSGPVAWGNRVASVLVQDPSLIDQYFQESTKGVTHFIDTDRKSVV